jgi:hypothetical protein
MIARKHDDARLIREEGNRDDGLRLLGVACLVDEHVAEVATWQALGVQQGGGAAGGHNDAVLGEGGLVRDSEMAQSGVEAAKRDPKRVKACY